jgi:hypothetical protein
MLAGLLYLYFRHPELLRLDAAHYVMSLSTDTAGTFVISRGKMSNISIHKPSAFLKHGVEIFCYSI